MICPSVALILPSLSFFILVLCSFLENPEMKMNDNETNGTDNAGTIS